MILQLLKKNSRIVSMALILLSVLYILAVIFFNRNVLFKSFNVQEYTNKFLHSQWRVPQSKTPISDEEFYVYASYKYINGENPILVNPEVPPFGKYFIGVFIKLFNNVHIASVLIAFASLLLVFLIIKRITSSFLAASVGVFLTSIHTLFTDQIVHSPQLDVFQLYFLLLMIYTFLIYEKLHNKVLLILVGVFFGLFISIKVFLIYYLLINGCFILYFLVKKESWRKALIDLVILNSTALITFIFTYFRYLMLGHSLRELLGVQKWILTFYSQSHIDALKLLGNYLLLIFTGHWRFWSTGYPIVRYENWSITWPVIFTIGLYSTYSLLKKKMTKESLLLIVFFIIYNLFLFIVPMFPRYLLMLFVPLHILIAIYFAKILRI